VAVIKQIVSHKSLRRMINLW